MNDKNAQGDSTVASGLLSGMRVVDVSQQLPGPYASALLAAYGATVIKVEPLAGDPSRKIDPDMFELINSGKECIRLDLKSTEGVDRLHSIVANSNVFIEGFRPGVADRIGASSDVLFQLNAALVYCSISGAGQAGPLGKVPMHDLNLQGLAGIVGAEGIGIPWVDLGTASMAALAIVSAWHRSLNIGIGCYIDAAMLDTAVLWNRVKASANERLEPTYGIFETADGFQVAVAILEDHIWPRLCRAFGWVEWAESADFGTYSARVKSAEDIRNRLAHACRQRSLDVIADLAMEYDLPITPAGSEIGQVATDHLALRGLSPGGQRRVPTPPTIDYKAK